jgi:MFS family permease
MPSPSTRSLRGLDALNFFLADVQTGVGPFVAIVLASQGLSTHAIGLALTVGGLAGVLSQIPVGALVDATRHKRALVAGAILATTASAVILALAPGLPLLFGAQALHGAATAVMGPAIVALSLGIVGRAALGQRLGRNRVFDSAGNLASAALMGVVGYVMAPVAIFWVTALLAIPSLAAVGLIQPGDIDDAAARGSTGEPPVPVTQLATNRNFLVFLACAVLFHFANASMLPLLATVLARGNAKQSSLLLSFCIEVTQVVVVLFAPWCGRRAERWGRRPLLLMGFALLPLRGLLLALTTQPALLVAIQVLDGLAATVFTVVAPLVVADVTRGSGRFNVAQGAIGTATAAGAAVSTTVTGYVVDHFGEAAGFLGLALVALLALLLLAVALPETKGQAAGDEQAPGERRLEPLPDLAARRPSRGELTPDLRREVEDAQ